MNVKIDFGRYAGCFALALLSALVLPAAANAEENAVVDQIRITPFLGYRAGGEFEDADTGTTLESGRKPVVRFDFQQRRRGCIGIRHQRAAHQA